ncbi:MAG TPA: hypothetical protein VJU82_00745, partial [Acidobacteriaceae bacterium]|nr:hypothetical protein [Acidobacteriaceae bacterium]
MKLFLLRSAALSAAILLTASQAAATQELGIDHRYQNTDAQSLIGLPLGSHKTTVEKDGSLKWSQWSLKRRELDSPIGFSAQMDGALAIQPFVSSATGELSPIKVNAQTLYREHYPFVVSTLTGAPGIKLEELAFAVDPEAAPGKFPDKDSGAKGFDVVRLTITNGGSTQQ